MDLHEVAEQIAAELRGGGLRLRQGIVDAVAADGSLTVRIGGSAVAVSGIRAFSSAAPAVGAAIWLAIDGPLLIAIGTIDAPT